MPCEEGKLPAQPLGHTHSDATTTCPTQQTKTHPVLFITRHKPQGIIPLTGLKRPDSLWMQQEVLTNNSSSSQVDLMRYDDIQCVRFNQLLTLNIFQWSFGKKDKWEHPESGPKCSSNDFPVHRISFLREGEWERSHWDGAISQLWLWNVTVAEWEEKAEARLSSLTADIFSFYFLFWCQASAWGDKGFKLSLWLD